jgi:membrane-associated phospholipid phosphatase
VQTTTPPPATQNTRFIAVFAAAVVVVLAVIIFGLTVAKGASYTAGETGLLSHIAGSRSPALVDLSLALDRLFGPAFGAIIGLVSAAIVFLLTRSWSTVIHFVLLVAGTWLSSEVVKLIVHRERPVARLGDILVPNPDPDSYPSGHVCFAVALGFAIFVVVTNSRLKVIVAVLAILLALVTAASRVYLGVHYPTDAVASLVYSAAAFVGVEALWRRFSAQLGLTGKRGSSAHRAA